MLQLKYPGVYTQEVASGVHSTAGAPTSVALFVGPARTGIDLRPTRLFNYGDFERNFGGLAATSNLSYSVLHFFGNGGGEAWAMRVPPKNAKPAASTLRQEVAAGDQSGIKSITLTALSSGAAGKDIFVEVDRFGISADPFLASVQRKLFNLTLVDRLTGTTERFVRLSMNPADSRYAPKVVNDNATGSKLVGLGIETAGDGPQSTGTIYKMGALPAGAKFTKDVALTLTVDVTKPDGSAVDPAASVANFAVTVFAKDEPKPATPLEVATRLAAAINQAIRGSAANAAKMQGVGVMAELFEGSTLLRLRMAPPSAPAPTTRVPDARVDIADPGAGPDSFLTVFLNGAAAVSNPSRYPLGSGFAGTNAVSAKAAGADGDPDGQPDSAAYLQAILSLDTPDPFFNLLCLPDLVRPSAADPTAPFHANAMTAYSEAARICGNKHAFLLIDPLPSVGSVNAAETWKSAGFTFQSDHAAVYFPNIRVDDPLVPGAIRSHPPSGAVAGVIARTDGAYGVWEAPAGTEASLSGVYGPALAMSDQEQGILNPLGVNCIRQFPIFGTVIFGSRTVDGSDALGSDWKYVPVRRTASYILRSLSEQLRWAVHKPNGDTLWAELRMNVTSFMQGLFRQGAFKGVSAREAYFVLCDASTTTPNDINNGVVNIVVGFAPLKPAEFVVITLRQIVQAAA